MEVRLEEGHDRVSVLFWSEEESDALLARVRERGELLLRLDERLTEGADVEIEVRHPLGVDTLSARVRQVFRSGIDLYGTLLAVPEVREAARAGASETPEGAETPSQAPASSDPPDERPSPAAAGDAVEGGASSDEEDAATASALDRQDFTEEVEADETLGRSLIHRIKELNPVERARLARRASRQERQILLRDGSPAISMQLLNNPHIEPREVLELVKNNQMASGILQRIAQDRRFVGNYEILLALVRNPQTPSPLAIRLAEQLRPADLRALAKASTLRENVRRAILRIHLSRMG